jgi:hypothetical protein
MSTLSQQRKLVLSEVEDLCRQMPEDNCRPYRAALRVMLRTMGDEDIPMRGFLLRVAAVCTEWAVHIDETAMPVDLPKLRKLPDGTWTDGLRHPEWDAIKGC